jgi:hypothetical protein
MSDWKTTYHRILRNMAERIRESQTEGTKRLNLWYRRSTETEYGALYVFYADVDVQGRGLELAANECIPDHLPPDELFAWIKRQTDYLPMLPTGVPL